MDIESVSDSAQEQDFQKIELAKEELHVSKKIETETLVFHKELVSENVEIPVELRQDEIEIIRIPKDEELSEVPQIRSEGNLTIIPVYEERAVVVKKLFLKEEIHIIKKEGILKETITDTLRHEVFREGGKL